jgi:hypothetical protein
LLTLNYPDGQQMPAQKTEIADRFQPIADLKRQIPIFNICWQGWRCDKSAFKSQKTAPLGSHSQEWMRI